VKKILFKKIKLIVILFLFVPAISKAQPFVDLLNLKYQFAPSTPCVADTHNRLSVKQYEGTFILPLVQKNKSTILIGGDITKLNFNVTGGTNVSANLYSTSAIIGYEKQWKNDKWKTLVMGIPKFNSDNVNFSAKDFQMGGVLLFKYKQNDSLKYHFGLYYNHEFFGNYFMPLLGIDWKINDRFSLYGDLPVNMNLEYKIAKSLFVGAAYFSTVASFRLNGTDGSYVREGDKLFGDNQFKLFVNYYIAKYVVIYIEGGQTVGRIYQSYNSNDQVDNTNPVFQKNSDGLFVDGGIAIRFRMDGK
jgi:hypothetical protein